MQTNVVFLATDIGRMFRKRFEAANRDSAVTGPQWRLLGAIGRNPGASQITLATLLEVEPITAGRMLDRLQQAGMVERRPDPDDRRAWRLYLTPRARPQMAMAREQSEALVARALHGFSPEERELLGELLERMRDNLGCGAEPAPERDTAPETVHG